MAGGHHSGHSKVGNINKVTLKNLAKLINNPYPAGSRGSRPSWQFSLVLSFLLLKKKGQPLVLLKTKTPLEEKVVIGMEHFWAIRPNPSKHMRLRTAQMFELYSRYDASRPHPGSAAPSPIRRGLRIQNL